jgi:hypothetical protein
MLFADMVACGDILSVCSFTAESTMLWMQMDAGVFVRQTESSEDTAEFIRLFTKAQCLVYLIPCHCPYFCFQGVATAPFKRAATTSHFNFFSKTARAPQKV